MINTKKLLGFLAWLDETNRHVALCDLEQVERSHISETRIRELVSAYNASESASKPSPLGPLGGLG